MKTYYIVAVHSVFKIKAVQAETAHEAEEIAYEVHPTFWDKSIPSDEFEHMETVAEDEIEESAYLQYLEDL